MAARMYRIGDYVYCDESVCGTSHSTNQTANQNDPYQIRRIEELFKTPYGSGGVEARVACFYRRRDLSSNLLNMLDRQTQVQSDEDEIESSYSDGGSAVEPVTGFQSDYPDLNTEQRYYLKHRELFLSRQIESIPATCIRGKCQVNLFNPSAETYSNYLSKEHVFFYRYLYDPQQKSLTIDRGEVRIGSSNQADVPETMEPQDEIMISREELIWSPFLIQPSLSDKEIDQVMLLARSVGTFARALDCSGSSVRSMDWSRPSGLHMSAAAASRDITLFHAMTCLHQSKYDIGNAVLNLVPSSGPVLCRDELEDWSASEAFLFEESLEKYGKDFQAIRKDVLPWKSTRSIVEYYYMWKTTDRYSHRKRSKNNDGTSSRLKQVFIPPYTKPSPCQFQPESKRAVMCDSCSIQQASRWFRCCTISSPNPQSTLTGILCEQCYTYWKHYGGSKCQNIAEAQLSTSFVAHQRSLLQRCHECDRELRGRHQFARHIALAHGIFKKKNDNPISPSLSGNDRIRDSFCLFTTQRTKLARVLCNNLLPLRKMWKSFYPANLAAIESEFAQKSSEELKAVAEKLSIRNSRRSLMNLPVAKGINGTNLAFPIPSPEELALFFTDLQETPNPFKHMKRPKLLPRNICMNNSQQNSSNDQSNRTHGYDRGGRVMNYQPHRQGPKSSFEALHISCTEGTDGIYVITTNSLKTIRRQIPISIIRKAARFPWRSIKKVVEDKVRHNQVQRSV